MEVSIIIPAYNRQSYIARAIRSAISQRFHSRFEVIVINDGSTDHTGEIAKDFSDVIKLIELPTNAGLSNARNIGIRVAKGRYIVNLDSDDYLHQDLIYVESLFLNLNPDWHAVSCDYFIVDENEQHIGRVCGTSHPIACGIMFRKDTLIKIGLYDEQIKMREEVDLRIRFEKKYKIHHIELPLYRYKKHKSNMTNNTEIVKYYENIVNNKHNPEVCE